jgi:hypothetical protein
MYKNVEIPVARLSRSMFWNRKPKPELVTTTNSQDPIKNKRINFC